MALKSPLKMKSYGNGAPNGVPKLATQTNETHAKAMKGRRESGKAFKSPGRRTGNTVQDQSSGQSLPINRGDDNKKRYHAGTPQPEQYSNASTTRKTKFVT